MTHTRTLKVQLLSSFLFFFLVFTTFSQDELSFLFVGDVMQHDGQINAARNKTMGSYEYEDGYKFVKPIINEYDIKVANLEVTLAGKPYKGYPQFSAPDELAETLVSTGFNVILTANNHSCDRGSKGVLRTLDVLDKLGVAHTGTFRNKEERDKNYPLMIEQNGMKVAMLNYTYGTNGLKVAAPLIINYIDSTIIKEDIEKAKSLNADYIICNMHWGKEYLHQPDKYQKKWEAFCYKVGADMVIGGHPHTVQPIVRKKIENTERLTVWSMGNFVSNMSIRYTRGGVMVGASLIKKDGKTSLGKTEQTLVYVHKKQEGVIKQYYILPEFDYNKYRPGFIPAEIQTKMDGFFADSRKLFNEHNVGIDENKIQENSRIGILYKQYLSSYYSVLIEEAKDELLLDKNIGPFIHETVDKSGKPYILSGVYETIQQAEGNLHFINDCKITEDAYVVKVTPNGITRVEK
ncbi:MAG: CapA family protein [Crocinitomicaceae bacterium]|nr:CapA family protein [Crocinitomicaceae bacterium]